MAIVVICPGCRSRFQVSEKFAGKSGACPKCKGKIKIPTKSEEVKIHGGEDFDKGGRDAAGQLVLKPIARQETRFSVRLALVIFGATVAAFAVAFLAGGLFRNFIVFRGVGLLVVSPPLVYAAYTFLRNDELEPYSGKELHLRAAVCSLVYVALWGVFAYVSPRLLTGEIWNWAFVAPPFFVIGALTALASLDLDFGSGAFHYSFYVLVTIFLRWAAGMGWLWNAANPVSS